jgi:hypothetical protein
MQLMIKLRTVIFLVVSMLLASCKENKIELHKDQMLIKVSVKSFKVIEEPDRPNKIFVYGDLIVENSKKNIELYDLNCVDLRIGQLASKSIYADSIASVLIDAYKADKQGRIAASVYWVFPYSENFNNMTLDVSNLELSLKSFDRCNKN